MPMEGILTGSRQASAGFVTTSPDDDLATLHVTVDGNDPVCMNRASSQPDLMHRPVSIRTAEVLAGKGSPTVKDKNFAQSSAPGSAGASRRHLRVALDSSRNSTATAFIPPSASGPPHTEGSTRRGGSVNNVLTALSHSVPAEQRRQQQETSSWKSRLALWNGSWKAHARAIRQAPARTLVLPVLVLLLCLGLGLLAVFAVSKQATEQLRKDTWSTGVTVTNGIKQQVAGLLLPLAVAASYPHLHPRCDELDQVFQSLASQAVRWAPDSSSESVYQLQLAPAGVLTLIYPPDVGQGALGLDLFAHPRRRIDALRVAGGKRMTLEGPYQLVEGGFAAIAYVPIYLDIPLDQPIPGCSRVPSNCTTCSTPGSNETFWGFAFALLDMAPLNSGTDPSIREMQKKYLYRLSRPATAINSDIQIAATAKRPRHPEVVDFTIYGATWKMEISPKGGWQPGWLVPCIIAVVLGSFALSGLLLLVLVAKEQHAQLLRQMLPRSAIKWLQQGRGAFVEHFECTTILFTDCVSYTSMSSALSPLDVVTILNELYAAFDALTHKHGVYKVETIGDAFMCVSGCPEPEDGPGGAARMAAMALDMVETVQHFVSSNGHKIQIRVGMHSGPVVAGIIGQKMPRYCLFGDTVNTASRMESNSKPMMIHISNDTASLLLQSEAGEEKQPPSSVPWQLSSRGRIPIKGKGTMETFWLHRSGSQPGDETSASFAHLTIFDTYPDATSRLRPIAIGAGMGIGADTGLGATAAGAPASGEDSEATGGVAMGSIQPLPLPRNRRVAEALASTGRDTSKARSVGETQLSAFDLQQSLPLTKQHAELCAPELGHAASWSPRHMAALAMGRSREPWSQSAGWLASGLGTDPSTTGGSTAVGNAAACTSAASSTVMPRVVALRCEPTCTSMGDPSTGRGARAEVVIALQDKP